MLAMREALRHLKQETEAEGIRLLIVIVPDGDQIGPAAPDLAPQIRLASFCREENLDCLDLHPLFAASPTPNLFMDIMHPNTAGHALIAKAISHQLVAP